MKNLIEKIPKYIFEIGEVLKSGGFEAFLVGGSIRDLLLGKIPDDYDIATNAYPEEIVRLFPKSIPTGAKFGTITVVVPDVNFENHDVEITTYRSEADYFGGRWPAKVSFAKTIEEDLSRRDFTINSLALDLASKEQKIKDPFGGLLDLKNGIIKAVGSPLERFTEDGLRAVRGCRFASQLDQNNDSFPDFTIEEKTFEAMKQTNHITAKVSVERFRDELIKLLMFSPKPSKGLRLLKEAGILGLFIPELLEGIDVTQPNFHIDNVFEHSIKTVDFAPDAVKLAALFHDIAKPRCKSEDETGVHFYGHDVLGAKMTEEIMKRLKFSNDEIKDTVRLVRWHMFYYPSADWRKSPDKSENTIKHGWSDSGIRRLIKNVGGEDAIDKLMKLRIADAASNPKSEFNPKELDELSKRIAEVRSQEMALKVTDLSIKGSDLISNFNLPEGPIIGEVMSYLLERVLDDPALNKPTDLLLLAKEYLEKSSTKTK